MIKYSTKAVNAEDLVVSITLSMPLSEWREVYRGLDTKGAPDKVAKIITEAVAQYDIRLAGEDGGTL